MQKFSKVFDIHDYFAVDHFIPNRTHSLSCPVIKNYRQIDPPLNVASWMPVAEKAYDIWLSEITK